MENVFSRQYSYEFIWKIIIFIWRSSYDRCRINFPEVGASCRHTEWQAKQPFVAHSKIHEAKRKTMENHFYESSWSPSKWRMVSRPHSLLTILEVFILRVKMISRYFDRNVKFAAISGLTKLPKQGGFALDRIPKRYTDLLIYEARNSVALSSIRWSWRVIIKLRKSRGLRITS